jgi:hypothetical protein
MQDELRSSLVSTVGMSRRGFLPNVVKDVTVGSQSVGKDLAEMSDCPELLHLRDEPVYIAQLLSEHL